MAKNEDFNEKLNDNVDSDKSLDTNMLEEEFSSNKTVPI